MRDTKTTSSNGPEAQRRPSAAPSVAVTDEGTGIFPTPAQREPTLSESLWGTCLYEGLPRLIDPRRELWAVRGDWARAGEFLKQFPGVREEAGCVPSPQASLAKQRYIQNCCDVLEARRGDATVGIFIGAPDDWSTYYCRLLAFDPQVSARVTIRRFFQECLIGPLRNAGVERLVGETAPTNAIMIRWFTELGFQPTGQRLTERWGPFVQFTKYLREESGRAFMRRFAPNGLVEGANDNNRPGE